MHNLVKSVKTFSYIIGYDTSIEKVSGGIYMSTTIIFGVRVSTWPFSAQHQRISAPRLLALTTEDWRGAEICRRSTENGYIDLPGP